MHTTRTVHIHRPQPRPLNRRCWTFRFVPTQSTLLPHYLYVKYHGTSFCCFAQSKVTYFFLSRKSLFNHSNQIILFFYDFCVFFFGPVKALLLFILSIWDLCLFFGRQKKNSISIHSIDFVPNCAKYELLRDTKKIRYLWLNRNNHRKEVQF